MVFLINHFEFPGATLLEMYTTTTELSNHRKEIERLGIIIICKKVRTKYVGLLKLDVAFTQIGDNTHESQPNT